MGPDVTSLPSAIYCRRFIAPAKAMVEKCTKHSELLSDYIRVLSLFNSAVQALHESRATATREEYDRIKNYVEQVRLQCEKARITWETHQREHGC